MDDYFCAIAGRDTFPMAKPDPGHLTGAIALAGGTPSRAVMIGDSDIDLKAAKAARVPAIFVSFGYASAPLDGLEPEALIGHFDELHASILPLLT
jgi:phosphoglycolate phosphatase